MKLHRLRIENLNSLYGEHDINFDEDLAGASLYLIAGPTGAGKSTILDAVSLALFGQTPRLRGTWSDEDETGTINIMSRGTGTCLADLEFSLYDQTGQRRRYRATWKMRRAREKADGNPQTPTRALYELNGDTEKALVNSDKAKDYDHVFEEALCKLSVDDFLKRIVLAQGEFAGFVRSTVENRRDILAKLVPTDRYKRLGEKVGRITSTKRGELKTLAMKLERDEDSESTPVERLKAVTAEKKDAEKKRADTSKTKDAADRRLAWLVNRDKARDAAKAAQASLRSAKAAWAELSEEQTALDKHQATLPFDVALNNRSQLVDTKKKLEVRSKSAVEDRDSLNKKQETSKKTLTALNKHFGSAEKSLTESLPKLKEAQQAWAAVREKTQELEQERKLLAAAEKTYEDAQKTHDDTQSALNEAEKSLTSSKQSLTELPYKTSLLERRQKVEDETWAWQNAEAELAAAAKANEKQAETVAKSRRAVTEASEKHEASKGALADKKKAVETAQATYDSLLKKADATSAEQLDSKLAQASKRLEAFDSLDRRRLKVRERANAKANATELADKTSSARDNAAAAVEAAETTVQKQQAKVDLCQQVLAGEKARAELVNEFEDGEPCPLCGSEDHAKSPEQVRDSIQERVEQASKNLQNAQADAGSLTSALESKKSTLRDTESARTTAKANAKSADNEHQQSVSAFQEQAAAANLPLTHAATDDESAQQRRSLSAEVNQLTRAAADHKKQTANLQNTKHALELTQKDADQADARLADVKTQLDEEQKQLADSKKERDRATDAAADAQRDLLSSLNADGWKLDIENTGQSAAEIAKSVREKLMVGADLQNKIAQDETRFEERSAALIKASELLKEANDGLTRQNKQVASATEDAAAAEKIRDGLFEGQKPDDVRAALDKFVADARQDLEHAQREADDLKTAITTNATTLTELKQQIADNEKLTDDVQQTLASLLDNSDFDTLDAVISARLEVDVARELQETITKASKTLESAKLSHESRQKELKEHLERKPDQMPNEDNEPDDYGKELRVQCEGLADALTALSEQIGRLRNEEDSIKKKLEEHKELRRTYDKALADFDIWRELHDLLGKSDGDHFVTWVLALTFEQLLQNANKHLRNLNPRYQLRQRREDTGERILDFHVVDLEAAGATRPTATLSGGETFLVSLALALGLSGLDSVDFKSETLLLDEGFGTLDKDSLDDALRTLEELHATNNVQVGLISHVESLQTGDRIPAQIRVEPRGDGRSTLRVVT